jgi:hypothetical protein
MLRRCCHRVKGWTATGLERDLQGVGLAASAGDASPSELDGEHAATGRPWCLPLGQIKQPQPAAAVPTPAHQEKSMSHHGDTGVLMTVQCPRCGEIDLTPDRVWLVVGDAPERTRYRFHCGGCDQAVSHPADDLVVAVLAELVGVEQVDLTLANLSTQDTPTLSVDDLLDLMLKPLTDFRAIETASSASRSAA